MNVPAETLLLKPGQIIIREGDISRELFVLLSGELTVTCGGKMLGRVTSVGEVVGELGALTGHARTASVSAKAPSEVLLVRQLNNLNIERMPSIIEKINSAITRRFYIVFNKTQMYKTITSTLRRSLLQQTLREETEAKRKLDNSSDSDLSIIRHQIRQRIDERIALYPDLDDPKVIEKIAQEYDALDKYREKVAEKPWLDDSLIIRLSNVESKWKLLEGQEGIKYLSPKAEVVIEAHQLLMEYERMPGIRKEMDLLRMEGIVPFKAKLETLKSVYFSKHLEEIDEERRRISLERKFKLTIDGVKADSGNDLVMLYQAARELGIEDEYEEQIKNLVAMSESGTHFVDISSSVVDHDKFTES